MFTVFRMVIRLLHLDNNLFKSKYELDGKTRHFEFKQKLKIEFFRKIEFFSFFFKSKNKNVCFVIARRYLFVSP